MEVLRIREDKLTSKLDRDSAVEARILFLTNVASLLHKVQSARNGLSERRKQLELPAVYLHRANMLRYEEYGELIRSNTICHNSDLITTNIMQLGKSKKHF